MKTHKNLFDHVCAFENIWRASRKAKRGKSSLDYVQQFEHSLETELHALRRELLSGEYLPGKYKEFMIYEPKHRMISAAPYRDRVVHHALCNVIEPIFQRSFLPFSFANQTGKGVHRAVDRFQHFARQFRYVVKCDVQKYFPCIDHAILKSIIRRKIACARTLQLIDVIIDHSNPQDPINEYFVGDDLFTPYQMRRGLPIGNLTSQFFANVYLDRLDHFLQEQVGVQGYTRYVDDFVFFGNNKDALYVQKQMAEQYLASLRLVLNQNKSLVHKAKAGVPFLGYRVFPEFRLLLNESIIRYRKKLAEMAEFYRQGSVSLDRVRSSVHGWIGHASQANTYRLRKAVFESVVFQKG